MRQVVVTVGVAIASYGEINFVVLGVVLQLVSVLTESTRLTLVQILLQARNSLGRPPACLVPCLCVPKTSGPRHVRHVGACPCTERLCMATCVLRLASIYRERSALLHPV